MKRNPGRNWSTLDNISDNFRIHSGVIIRMYDVGLNVKNAEEDFYDYIISEIYGEAEFFQLVCISSGEGGNIGCILKRHEGDRYVLGRELKRMLADSKNNVFINMAAKIKIE